jgi:bicarbonate transport system permease protein
MTLAQKCSIGPKVDNSFLSSLQKQFPELVPPVIAFLIFLTIWQLFSWTPRATLAGPIQVIQDT